MKLDYKDAEAALAGLRRGEPRAVEEAIHFLSQDVFAPGTGYLKEQLWKRLRLSELRVRQRERLQRVVLKYVREGMRREFRSMCRAMATLGDAQFRSEVEDLARSEDAGTRRRANALLVYLEG